ncbi:hypothetical protein [Cryobacterium psychrophilum]|uniref:Uncharacterized protein n=1 Tax=Cryobacterium psychrophilum TaxID=41988 RepID=A0A4Y8KRZ2_9MICO|nr:hypothetical protein [Cryobacterium psychrophilum]TDW28699.1 hypothetical protein EDD25_0327 [Cryobacterium psychrophilum]TFD82358.1 hypothetical protein E3T53_00310 [Cryobacterium psychrophilum]
MTPEQIALSSLQAEWWGVAASFLTVIVAAIFGFLTLLNNRRALDAQNRAALAAVTAAPRRPGRLRQAALIPANAEVAWAIESVADGQWMLINAGTATAYDVALTGYTDLDQRRISVADGAPRTLAPGEALAFTVLSRFTLRGPANVVVTFAFESGAATVRQTLRAPAR